MKNNTVFLLIPIFIIALTLRFLYFPDDIYFGIDQANGSFAAEEILKGHLKLIGPSTTFEGLRHGVLYYYLYAPFYLLGNGDPSFAAFFLRIVNAAGIFLIYLLAKILFNRYVGIISAFLFAISFEQTQFALYFNHPSLAVISILTMYLGLALFVFKKNPWGLTLSLLGLGLSFQFEFILTYLTIPFLIILIVLRKEIPKISLKKITFGSIIFLLTVSTYIIAEIKFSFRGINALTGLLGGQQKDITKIFLTYFFEMGQMIKFNVAGIDQFKMPLFLILVGSYLFMLLSKFRKQAIFLGAWFFSGLVIYFIAGGDVSAGVIQYHPNMGLSLSIIIFSSLIIYIIGRKTHFLTALILIVLIFVGNYLQIQKINPFGSMPEINAQSFMLLSDEKKVLDYIYNTSNGKLFAVKGITLPFYINTTWSYLFEWYGMQKYGYLPIWGGKNASGHPGNLLVQEAQDKLPEDRYLIIEPTRGIPEHLISAYLQEESYFSNIVEEKRIGKFVVQKRIKK